MFSVSSVHIVQNRTRLFFFLFFFLFLFLVRELRGGLKEREVSLSTRAAEPPRAERWEKKKITDADADAERTNEERLLALVLLCRAASSKC